MQLFSIRIFKCMHYIYQVMKGTFVQEKKIRQLLHCIQSTNMTKESSPQWQKGQQWGLDELHQAVISQITLVSHLSYRLENTGMFAFTQAIRLLVTRNKRTTNGDEWKVYFSYYEIKIKKINKFQYSKLFLLGMQALHL